MASENGIHTNGSTKSGSALDAVKDNLPNGLNTKEFASTNWAGPGASEYNFFSDTATTGTLSMLQAIVQTTLQDDVFHEDTTTNELERWVAGLFGFEAGLLVTSGTMGNQLALRAHLVDPPHSVVADERAHIFSSEAGGLASLSQAMCYGVRPEANGAYVTLEDVARKAVLAVDDDALHHCPTRVIVVENTIGGVVTPLAECRRIADWARGHGIAMHMDGARIWEAVASQVAQGEHGGDLVQGLKAYAECFDSIQTCFSKGLGAPIGSIVLSNDKLIRKARHHRKAIGGGLRATGIIAAPARIAIQETFLAGKLVATHVLAKRIAERWTGLGGKLLYRVDTNMVWVDLPGSGIKEADWLAALGEEGIRAGASRMVFHYQLSEDAMQRLGRAIDKVFQGRTK